MAFLLALGLAVGGFGFGLVQQQRAQRAEAKLAQKRVELERTERLLAAARARAELPPAPTPVAPPEPEAPPAVAADAGAAEAPVADAGDDLGVISALRPKLRTCFDNALAYAPASQGRLDMMLLVSESGIVDDVTAVASGDLPAPVTRCAKAVAKTARFGPATQPRSVRFPVVFQN